MRRTHNTKSAWSFRLASMRLLFNIIPLSYTYLDPCCTLVCQLPNDKYPLQPSAQNQTKNVKKAKSFRFKILIGQKMVFRTSVQIEED